MIHMWLETHAHVRVADVFDGRPESTWVNVIAASPTYPLSRCSATVMLRRAMEICGRPLALLPLPRYSCWNATHDTGCIIRPAFAGLHPNFKH